jgi:hypothetical protein
MYLGTQLEGCMGTRLEKYESLSNKMLYTTNGKSYKQCERLEYQVRQCALGLYELVVTDGYKIISYRVTRSKSTIKAFLRQGV